MKKHIPVLLNEVLHNLNISDNKTYIDCTFGFGGYSCEILKNSKNSKLIAIDRDITTKEYADKLKKEYKDRFFYYNENFSNFDDAIKKLNIDKVDGIVFDLGVSSMQLDEKERGFSFDSDSKLDMRMNQNDSISAFEVINMTPEKDLAKIIKEYGEEPKAKLIAKKIIEKRKEKNIYSCIELANIVRSFYKGYFKIDPATKTFQAIRIFVNKELQEIEIALNKAINYLNIEGRIVVVSFHSLEDKIAKRIFVENSSDQAISRYQPELQNKKTHLLKIINKSAIKPSDKEQSDNNRSRSARLRTAIKISN